MGTFPESPRSDFLAWCVAHKDVFTTNQAALGLTAAQTTAFKTAVTDAASASDAQTAAKDAAQAATTAVNLKFTALRDKAAEMVRTIRTYAENTNNPGVYALAQIPPPAAGSPVPPPAQPTNLTVAIDPATGAIQLKWKAANPAGSSGTSYIVRRKLPTQTSWEFVGVTGSKAFTDSSFAAGPDSVQYTVQGQRSDQSGPVSGILTVNFGHPGDRKSTRLNSSHSRASRMPSSA